MSSFSCFNSISSDPNDPRVPDDDPNDPRVPDDDPSDSNDPTEDDVDASDEEDVAVSIPVVDELVETERVDVLDLFDFFGYTMRICGVWMFSRCLRSERSFSVVIF
jgi:hypothetical protein